MPHVPVRHPFGAATRSKSAGLPICRTGRLRTYSLFQKNGPPGGVPLFLAVETVCSELVSEFPVNREKNREFFVFHDTFLNIFQILFE